MKPYFTAIAFAACAFMALAEPSSSGERDSDPFKKLPSPERKNDELLTARVIRLFPGCSGN
jgi:hypothetical protein